jgi:ribosomal-protein-alanine N-acetyltransferase
LRHPAGDEAVSRPGISEVTTSRLKLLPFADRDLPFLHDLWTDPDVRRYLWDDRVITLEEARAVVESSIASFSTRGFGFWVVHSLTNDEPIGFTGLREFGDVGEIELLYGLLPRWWGRGLATDAATGVLQFGFGRCQLKRIFAGTDPPNEASIRVIERLGMHYDSRRAIGGVETLYYMLDRPPSSGKGT